MGLNQKYTWRNFLKDNPEYKEKKIKRTSKEGTKAFESAFKQHAKEYLKERLGKIDKEQERIQKDRDTLNKKLKGTKTCDRAKKIQVKLGAKKAYLAKLERIHEKTKSLQKSL